MGGYCDDGKINLDGGETIASDNDGSSDRDEVKNGNNHSTNFDGVGFIEAQDLGNDI